MPHVYQQPAVRAAFNFVKKQLSAGVWRSGERLPSAQAMAAMAHVSRMTMIKAIALCRAKRLVHGLERQRIYAGPAAATPAPRPEKQAPWQRKKQLLEKEIIGGSCGLSGRLPALKDLQSRYGVCFRTMHKMLQSLESDGVIRPVGKGFEPVLAKPRQFRPTIVFITFLGHFSQVSALNHAHNRVVSTFENECLRLGLEFEIREIDFYDQVESRKAITRLVKDERTLGFILDVWWYDSESFRRAYLDVLGRLEILKKPVAVLDELGNFDLPKPLALNCQIQVFTIEGSRAGERVTRFLMGMGHSSIAYLSDLHYTKWSKDRFAGVEEQFKRLGNIRGLHLVAAETPVHFPFVLTASGLADSDTRLLMGVGRTDSQKTDLEKQWQEFKKSSRFPYPGIPRLGAESVRHLAAVAEMARNSTDPYLREKTINGAVEAAGVQIYDLSLGHLFHAALRYKDVTAWICATDSIALKAIGFLRSRGVQVPGQISVVGFDNIPVEALERRLTTFDFNATGFIHRMLNFISRTPRARAGYRHSTIEIEGILMERDTASKATNLMV